MDKLDAYVEQVCRRIGGAKTMRQHVRQELREHLLDAAAEHQKAGMSEADALARALEDFGKPEDVRSELEAAHGQRLMAVLIDKAIEWKELTMRAKWLWMSWATLAVVCVIALEIMFIAFNTVFIVPRFQKLMADGLIDPAIIDEHGMSWMPAFLNTVQDLSRHTTWYFLIGAVLWGIFEWRVRSEHKAFMRISALGTLATLLMIVVFLMAGAMVISFTLGMPALGRMSRPFALEQTATINTSVAALEKALTTKDWDAATDRADKAWGALQRLSVGPALNALWNQNEGSRVDELRASLKSAIEGITEVQQAARDQDAGKLDTALKRFQRSYDPVREAAKRPER